MLHKCEQYVQYDLIQIQMRSVHAISWHGNLTMLDVLVSVTATHTVLVMHRPAQRHDKYCADLWFCCRHAHLLLVSFPLSHLDVSVFTHMIAAYSK